MNSGHTSTQANEPLLCPLFNMDVTPAGYSLSHCENYFSIKMQKLERCPGKAAKNTALWGTYHRGLSGHLPHPPAPRKVPPPAGSSCKHSIQCLRLILAPSGRKSTGSHASFTDGQTEVTALHLQSHLGSKRVQPRQQGRKITPHVHPALDNLQRLLTHGLAQASERSYET